jgi:transcriptional regulator with XRE-family HTH domain
MALIGPQAHNGCLKFCGARRYVRTCADLSGLAVDPSETTELSDALSRDLAAKVREELARRRISRQRLADDAKISISTLEKALSGTRPFTLATIIRLEEALKIKLRPTSVKDNIAIVPAAGAAPVDLGGYSLGAVKWLEGDYLTLRPSFEVKDAVFAYRTKIEWSADKCCLCFHEAERLDAPFSQKGVISIPNKSGQIYLHTNDEGQFRLAILGRPLISGELYGLLTTLRVLRGGQLQPVSTPLALLPIAKQTAQFGRITSADPLYQTYHAHLERAVNDDYIRFVFP